MAYGIKLKDPIPHHLNSKGVWTSLSLPAHGGDWMEFKTRYRANLFASENSPSKDFEIVELT